MNTKDQLAACLASSTIGPEERQICTTYSAMLERGKTLDKNQQRFVEKLLGEVRAQGAT